MLPVANGDESRHLNVQRSGLQLGLALVLVLGMRQTEDSTPEPSPNLNLNPDFNLSVFS